MDFSMELNDNKAGLEQLDKERINAIIRDASKNSLYSKYQKKRENRIMARIQQQQDAVSRLSLKQIRLSEQEMDRMAKKMEESRDLSSTIIHIDMDAFYAAVEMRDNAALRIVPMSVGSTSMLCTSNYIARRFGVRAGMAGYIGKKLCPQLVIVAPDFRKYTAVSEEVRSVLVEYDPNFVSMSLDEAYLDVTDYLKNRRRQLANDDDSKTGCSHIRRRYSGSCVCKLPILDNDVDEMKNVDKCVEKCEKCGEERLIISDEIIFGHTVEEVTKELRFRIEQKTGLTASAGIAVNKMLAKVCSDMRKPNGQYYLPPDYEAIMEFVRRLPIRKVPGIGGVTESMLKALGISTCADLYEKRGLIALIHSPISTRFFLRVSLGLCSSFTDSFASNSAGESDRKSISTERTFSEISDPEELVNICRKLCAKLADEAGEEGLKARTVVLKLKTVEFDVKTRATTLDNYVCDFENIFNAAKATLLSEIAACEPQRLRLRLMGVRLSSFQRESEAFRLKVPEITRFLRAASEQQPTASCSKTRADSSCSEASEQHPVVSLDNTTDGEDDTDDGIIEIDDVDEDLFASAAETVTRDFSGDNYDRDDANSFATDDDEPKKNTAETENVENAMGSSGVSCPVCNFKFYFKDSVELNAHVDQCLSRRTVSEIIKSQDRELFLTSPSTSQIDSKSPTSTTKRKSSEEKNARKNRRSTTQFQTTPKSSKTKSRKTIEDYFKPIRKD